MSAVPAMYRMAGKRSRKQSEHGVESDEPQKKKLRISKDKSPEIDFNYVIKKHDTLYTVYPENWEARSKIAAFDMDSTLICPKGKSKFSVNRQDWKWQFGSVTATLKKLYNKYEYRIVIFTNQAGIELGKINPNDITGKIIDLSEALGIPITGLISSKKDIFRKPNTFMWDYFVNNLHKQGDDEKEIEIDMTNSFYCGDAAGRPAKWNGDKKCKRDFSVSDRKFAANIGIKFKTPEPLFLKHNECKKFEWRSLNPTQFLSKYDSEPKNLKVEDWFHGTLPIARDTNNGKELDMVIMVGSPGSGKTTFATNYLQQNGYMWINRDLLKTQKKCHEITDLALSKGKNVVIDNTNPNKLARSEYIKIGKKYNCNIRCFIMNVSKELAEHMNVYREKLTKGKIARIPTMAFNIFFKQFRENGEPSKNEGIDEICKIDFVPRFKNEQEKKLFLQWN